MDLVHAHDVLPDVELTLAAPLETLDLVQRVQRDADRLPIRWLTLLSEVYTYIYIYI